MPIHQIQKNHTIAVKIDASNQNDFIRLNQLSLVAAGGNYLPGYKLIAYNVFLKNLKAFACIKSLPEIELPDFTLEDTETDKTYKVLKVEWESPRKQLDLFVTTNATNWYRIGSIPMLNPAGYPFRVYSLFDFLTDNIIFELGDNAILGAKIIDAGTDLLADNDEVVIHGSYTEEIFLESAEQPINIYVTGNNSSPPPPPPATSSYIDNSSIIDNSFSLVN